VEHVGEPLGRRQRLEHHEQGEADGVGEQRLVLGVDGVGAVHDRIGQALVERLLAARLARPQHVERHAADGGDEPGLEVVDRVGVRAAEPDPRLLHGVVGLARRAEHPVRDRAHPGPVLLEPLCQPVVFVHRSPDPPWPPDVTCHVFVSPRVFPA
jgi:hypothetical protein